MASKHIRVRRAGVEDAQTLIDLSQVQREEALFKYPSADKALMEEVLEVFVKNPNLGFASIAESDKPIGYISGFVGVYLFSQVKRAAVNFWYVLPEFRASRAGHLLFLDFENWAKEINAEEIVACLDHRAHVEKYLLRRGYEKFAVEYRKCQQQY